MINWTCQCGVVHPTGTYCGKCDSYAPGCDQGLAQEAAKPKWISVEDRLPEKDLVCLVAYDENIEEIVTSMERYEGDKSWTSWNRNSDVPVTHWQPLPELPK